MGLALARWYKHIQLSVLTMGSSVFIAACYGAQYSEAPPEAPLVDGQVTHEDVGVGGIKVCASRAKTNSGESACDFTDDDGNYAIDVSESFEHAAGQDGFTLDVEDVDGSNHGSFEPEHIEVPVGAIPRTVDIQLTPIES